MTAFPAFVSSLASLPGPAFAAVAPTAGEVPLVAEIAGIVLPIVLLIGALAAVLYLLRKRHGIASRDAPLSVVQVLAVGPRERIVVVRTRSGRALAVGVASHSVRLIASLGEDDLGTRAQSVDHMDE
jgi:flagellar protein FliO/FliZ